MSDEYTRVIKSCVSAFWGTLLLHDYCLFSLSSSLNYTQLTKLSISIISAKQIQRMTHRIINVHVHSPRHMICGPESPDMTNFLTKFS